ncbi:MAG: hypothetical protein IIZ09_00155 [Ruminococcus sp.]|nr:hypothetical protein [Ruminococcus sp.]
MACFLVPTAEAVVTTVLNKTLADKVKDENKISFINRLGRLNGMLWGGSGLLAFEHLWHGEISPFFPFLTAASDPADTAEMLHEMATSGTAMAVLVTAVWALTVAAEKHLKAAENETVGKAGATS